MPEISSVATIHYGTYFSEEFRAERSVGCHLMLVIEDLESRIGKAQSQSQFDRDQLNRFATLGFVWERLIGRALTEAEADRRPEELVRPGEQFLDGIYATPDAFDVRRWRVEEWKCSWKRAPKSEAEFEERHWKWIVQSMAYMHVMGTREGIIRAFFVMGMWGSSKEWRGPEMQSYEIRATDEELREVWAMVLAHKRTMEKEGTATWQQ